MQWVRSSYVLLFQMPWLSEGLLSARDFWLIEQGFKTQPTNPNAFTPADIARYKEAFSRPGAIMAGLNYYRAALRYPQDWFNAPQAVTVPTLVIWGDRDPFLSKRLTKKLNRYVPNLEVEHLPASHWVQNDAPEEVNRRLIEFIRKR